MKKKIRVVQFGVSHEHGLPKLETLLALPDDFEIAGVVDDRDGSSPRYPPRRPDSLLEGLPVLTEEQVWADRTIEAAIVETANADLIPTAERVLAHGLHMHLDKPGGESFERYANLRKTARSQGLHVQMGYMFRANPAVQWLVGAVRQGWLGDIWLVEADMDRTPGDSDYQRYIGTFQAGLLYNLGSHIVDYLVSMLGEAESARPPIVRDAPGSRPGSRDYGIGFLEWASGAIGVVRACACNPFGFTSRKLCVKGTNGSAEICPVERFDGMPLCVELSLGRPAEDLAAGRHTLDLGVQGTNNCIDRYIDQLRQFARIVRGEEHEPDDLCGHDLAVQRTLLRMCGLSRRSK